MKTLFKGLMILFLSVTLINSFSAYSQFVNYGLKGGLNIANIGGGDASNNESRIGVHGGAFLGFSLLGIVGAEGGIYLSQKGYDDVVTIDNVAATRQNSFLYADIPVVLKFSPLPLIHMYAGPQFSYLLSRNSDWGSGSDDSTEGFNQLDMAAVIGLGVNLPFGLRVTAGYDYGFTSLYELEAEEVYNRVIKITVGYKF